MKQRWKLWCLVIASYSSITLVAGHILNQGYPILRFLFGSNDRFRDVLVQLSGGVRAEIVEFAGLNVIRGVFPGGVILYYHLGQSVGISFNQTLVVYNLIALIVLAIGLAMYTRNLFVVMFMLTSYPVMFAFLRGNNEVLTFGFFIIGLAFLERSRSTVGPVMMWVGQLIEPNWMVTTILGFLDRLAAMRLALIGLIAFGFAVLISQSSDPLEIAYDTLRFVLLQGSSDTRFQLTHNVSLAAGVTGWLHILNDSLSLEELRPWLDSISVILTCLAVIVIAIASRRRFGVQPETRIVITSCILVLVPLYSFPYRAVWLLIPLWKLLDRASRNRMSRAERWQLTLILLAISPKTWFELGNSSPGMYHYEATLVDPFLILAVLAISLTSEWRRIRKPSDNSGLD